MNFKLSLLPCLLLALAACKPDTPAEPPTAAKQQHGAILISRLQFGDLGSGAAALSIEADNLNAIVRMERAELHRVIPLPADLA